MGLFILLKNILAHLGLVPLHMFMDYVPDVAGFKKLEFKNAPSYICESKLKRTKPFYVAQFEALKALTRPEVSY